MTWYNKLGMIMFTVPVAAALGLLFWQAGPVMFVVAYFLCALMLMAWKPQV